MSGPATYEMGLELHRVLVEALLADLKGTPSAALMSVARSLLKQEGVTTLDMTERERKKLQALYRLLLDKLFAALTEERPTAAVLAEVRHFIASQGIGKDLGSALDSARALQALKSTDLPFH